MNTKNYVNNAKTSLHSSCGQQCGGSFIDQSFLNYTSVHKKQIQPVQVCHSV